MDTEGQEQTQEQTQVETQAEQSQEEREPTMAELEAILDGETIEDPQESNEQAPAESKEEPPKEDPKEEPFSKKFAELAQMESKYQKQMRELKGEIESLKSGSEGKVSKDELLNELRNEYKKNPKAFLEKKLGGSYDELSDYILNEEDRSKEYEMKEIISELKNEISELKGNWQEKEKTEKQKAFDNQVNEFKGNIKNFIESKGEEYGLISKFDEVDTVFDVMESYYDEYGKTLDVDEACAQVEAHLEERLKGLSGLSKVKNLFGFDNTNEVIKKDQSKENREEARTITNDFTSSYSESDLEGMSDDERERLALSIL